MSKGVCDFERRTVRTCLVNSNDESGREILGLWKLHGSRVLRSQCSASREGVLGETGSRKIIGSPSITRSLTRRSIVLVAGRRSTGASGPCRYSHICTAQPRARRVVAGIHGLIQGAKQHYERGYKVEEGQLLRPYKRQLVDVTASATGLDKALAFANDLFNALESNGHRVRFAFE